jgi:hypothetical protein
MYAGMHRRLCLRSAPSNGAAQHWHAVAAWPVRIAQQAHNTFSICCGEFLQLVSCWRYELRKSHNSTSLCTEPAAVFRARLESHLAALERFDFGRADVAALAAHDFHMITSNARELAAKIEALRCYFAPHGDAPVAKLPAALWHRSRASTPQLLAAMICGPSGFLKVVPERMHEHIGNLVALRLLRARAKRMRRVCGTQRCFNYAPGATSCECMRRCVPSAAAARTFCSPSLARQVLSGCCWRVCCAVSKGAPPCAPLLESLMCCALCHVGRIPCCVPKQLQRQSLPAACLHALEEVICTDVCLASMQRCSAKAA